MISSEDIATSHVLKHCTCLKQKASRRNLDCNLLHVAKPNEEARVARLSMNSEEVKIVVEASKCGAYIILLKI
jgi:hypothetical protein